jgi:toxin ParE1/3/4
MAKVVRRPGVVADLVEIGIYYVLNGSPGAAERFLDAVESAFQLLARHPRAGRVWKSDHPRLSNLRFWPVKGFESLLVFYREIPEGIEVIRVLHGARELQALLDNDETAGEEQS